MIWPVVSLKVILRLPFTAWVEVTPSRAPLPPNRFTILPRAPASWNFVFSSARTSARIEWTDASSRQTVSAAAVRVRVMEPPRGILHRLSFWITAPERQQECHRDYERRPSEGKALETQPVEQKSAGRGSDEEADGPRRVVDTV